MMKGYSYELLAVWCLVLILALATQSRAMSFWDKVKCQSQTLDELEREGVNLIEELKTKLSQPIVDNLFDLKNSIESDFPLGDERSDFYKKLSSDKLIPGFTRYMRQAKLNAAYEYKEPFDENSSLGIAILKEYQNVVLACKTVDEHLHRWSKKTRNKILANELFDWIKIVAICKITLSKKPETFVRSFAEPLFVQLEHEEEMDYPNTNFRTLEWSVRVDVARLKKFVVSECHERQLYNLHQFVPPIPLLTGIAKYMNFELESTQTERAKFNQMLIERLVNQCRIVHEHLDNWWQTERSKLLLHKEAVWMIIESICRNVVAMNDENEELFAYEIYNRFIHLLAFDVHFTSYYPIILL